MEELGARALTFWLDASNDDNAHVVTRQTVSDLSQRFGLDARLSSMLAASLALLTLLLLATISGFPRFILLALTLIMLFAAGLCRMASTCAKDSRTAAGWNWLMLTMVFVSLYFAVGFWNTEYIFFGLGATSAFVEIAVILGYVCCITGLAYAVQIQRTVVARIIVDTLVVIAGVTVIAVWSLRRAGIVMTEAHLTSPLFFRPLLDLALLMLVVVALVSIPRHARLHPSLIRAIIALGLFIVAHGVASLQMLRGAESTHGFVFLIHGAAGLAVAAAAWVYVTGTGTSTVVVPLADSANGPLSQSFLFHFGNAVIPYTIAISAATLLFTEALNASDGSTGSGALFAGSLAFIAAGGVRHALSHIENRNLYRHMSDLNRDLEDLVDRRTSELLRRNEELEAVHKIAMISAVSLDLPATLSAVAEQLTQTVGASRCVIRERTTEGVRVVARYDTSGPPPTGRLRELSSSFLDIPPDDFEPVGFRSMMVKRWMLPQGSSAGKILDAHDSSVALIIPLVASDTTLGVAELYRVNAEPFDEQEISLAEAVATQAALASENARAFVRARFAANHDPVTGLLNHRALYEELARNFDRAMLTGSPLTVIMMDLNLFKEFNDRFGHQAGDSVLTSIGQAIKSSMPTTAITARYGGDEFTVVIPDCPPENAGIFVSAIREHVDRIQTEYGFVGTGFGVAMGIASYPEDGTNLNALVAMADERMYEDKWRLKGYPDRRRPRHGFFGRESETSVTADLNL